MRQVRDVPPPPGHFHAPFSGHAPSSRAQQMETAKTYGMFKPNSWCSDYNPSYFKNPSFQSVSEIGCIASELPSVLNSFRDKYVKQLKLCILFNV